MPEAGRYHKYGRTLLTSSEKVRAADPRWDLEVSRSAFSASSACGALQVIVPGDPRLAGLDLVTLDARAAEQFARVEQRRLEAAALLAVRLPHQGLRLPFSGVA